MQVILSKRLAGTERHVIELCATLRPLGWRCLIAAPRHLESELRRRYERTAELRLLPDVPFPFLVPGLATLARAEGVDLFHGHLGNGSFAALAAARLTSLPCVATAHFVEARNTLGVGGRPRHAVYCRAMQRVTALVAVSEAVATSLRHDYPSGRPPIHVVHNGIDGLEPMPATLDGDAGPVVLFAGRFAEEKRVDLLVRAMAMTAEPSDLWLAGRGPEEARVRRLCDELLPGRARVLGFVGDLAPLLRQARVVAVPSRAEPFGLICLEAMRAGKPVVGFASGALPEIVVDGETGLLVRHADPSALAGALGALMNDETAARRFGEAGSRRFLTHFTAARMAEETADVYRWARAAGPAAQRSPRERAVLRGPLR
jgi:glycosyltransferase involved in cell wall biosynthesis